MDDSTWRNQEQVINNYVIGNLNLMLFLNKHQKSVFSKLEYVKADLNYKGGRIL
jgi:hypothetical protein